MGNMQVVINKFVILSKLRKEVARVNFSFKKWGVAVHTRLEREWVIHDLKGNKVECPLKSNGDTRIFVWHSHKENGDAHVWHSHKDKGEGKVPLRKEKKRCASPHKIRVMYERKTRIIINERALCGSHTKLSGTVILENWRTCVAVHK